MGGLSNDRDVIHSIDGPTMCYLLGVSLTEHLRAAAENIFLDSDRGCPQAWAEAGTCPLEKL